ncbi:hypothetical protein Y032_0012g1638 [Ancylostoma ceylanicum]|uniref:Uncharacterized protein n=1 Tax=Ancylostoma ceylanicum TaxID=53326 RepID=A0A016VE44_9BILA|nr:hypothetical protein Y032_0012g1638 [Ancylostoma ceylanicum]
MLSFHQGNQESVRSNADDQHDDMFLSNFHVRVATLCFLLSSWLIWCAAVTALMLTYDVLSMELCWKWAHCSIPSVLVILHGLILVMGTLGWFCSSPAFSAFLLVPPMSFCGAIIGVVINYWVSKGATSLEYCESHPLM